MSREPRSGKPDFALAAACVAAAVLPVGLALWLPVKDVDWATPVAIPCGLIASIAAALLAARRRRRHETPLNAGAIFAYAALAMLATGLLSLIVFAIQFDRTPLTF